MERKKASDFHPEVLSLFDQYVHGLIDRRAFLARASKFAVGGMTASMLLDEDKARELFAKLDQAKTREDFLAALAFLEKRPECNGKVGAMGFCYGGGMVNFLATRAPELAAAVPFYGGQPPAEDVAKIKAPLLIHYAEKDDRINAGIPAFEQALKANKVKYSSSPIRARSTASTT